jgi:hypothetical protein
MRIKMINKALTQFRIRSFHTQRVRTREVFTFTGHRDGNLSNHASYSGGPRFKSPLRGFSQSITPTIA